MPRLASRAALLALLPALAAAPAGAQTQLLTNGGFETGTLAGWTTSGLGTTGTCPAANRDWNVGSSGAATGCSNPGNPVGSTYAAYNMLDGAGPLRYSLAQTFIVPVGLASATLTFSDAAVWGFSGSARTFSARFVDGANAVLGTPYTRTFSGSGSYGWTGHGLDVTGILQPLGGQSVTLRFDVDVPAAWTGAAGMGLDNVSLTASAVPEPGTWALMATGLLALGGVARRRRPS